jgi:hypothetical protein
MSAYETYIDPTFSQRFSQAYQARPYKAYQGITLDQYVCDTTPILPAVMVLGGAYSAMAGKNIFGEKNVTGGIISIVIGGAWLAAKYLHIGGMCE